MKKIISLLMTFTLLMSLSLCALATDLSDGVYEVPVTLMHKEDEKESFGNKYVAQTALLEIEGGKKTITILLTTDMDGIEFSYYTDGSLSGDVAEGTPVSNITVAGETYESGFEIPVAAEGDIGLQFSVPVMPMSPSARLRIDYANAVLISSDDANEESQEQTSAAAELVTQVTEETEETEATEASTVAETTETTVATTVATTATATEATTVAATAAVSATQVIATEGTAVSISEDAEGETEKEENTGSAFIFVLLFIAGTVGMALLLTGDPKEKEI